MKKLILAASLCSLAAVGLAESQRSLFTHENKFPGYRELEVGGLFNYNEYESRDERILGAYARYTILTNLTLNTTVPFKTITPDDDDSEESGLGDIRVGVDLVAYEDIFEYPYIIPHATVALSTGDEDDGLGTGQTVTTLGISIGTVTHDCLHWVLDVSYAIDGGSENENSDDDDRGNILFGSLALIWELNEKSELLLEGRVSEDDSDDEDFGDDDDDTPLFGQAGIIHRFTKNFDMGFYAGAGTGGPDDSEFSTTVKGSYTF